MYNAIAVGLGGCCGALARWWITSRITDRFPKHFAFATLTVNLLGCLLIGLLTGWLRANPEMHPGWKLFLITGLLGSLTTFSTFGLDSVTLLQEGRHRHLALSVALHLALGLVGVIAGLSLAGRVWKA